MKYLYAFICIIFLTGFNPEENTKTKPKQKPNIIYILADDLGYGDLGCYGQEIIETPNIDALAANGMKFTQHYAGAPVCAPSRCVLLTGKHMGNAYIRGNDPWSERGDVKNYAAVEKDLTLEGQRPIPDSTITLAELLKTAGYKTACVGKWGLGPAHSEGSPNKQGFDFFYGYNCQRQAHTYYPTHLWKNEEPLWLDNKFVDAHKTKFPINADPYDEKSYSDFTLNEYTPDLMISEALTFIENNKEQPFFMYYASPIPHVPLQVTKPWVDKYRKIIGEEKPYIKGSYFPNQYPRATYAGMVSYLDHQVGQLVNKLKELGIYENTLIIFTSDNGASYTGGADTKYFNSNGVFDEKRGRGKGYLHEGGIRVPMIATWEGKIEQGSEIEHISSFYDVLPTFCELLNIEAPNDIDGISFLPGLLDKGIQKQHEYLYWEFPEKGYKGQQAVRMGKWKAIRKNILKGNMEIELYDLDTDIKELNNVAAKHPELVSRFEEIMKKEHTPAELPAFKMTQLGD